MTTAWAFAVAAWKRPGVEAICLELQDIHGQSPALLLWRCRTLEESRAVDPKSLAEAVQIAREWEGEALRPLRALSRRLTSTPASLAKAARAAVRRRVLDAELEAEHALLDALEVLETPGVASGDIARLQAIIDLAEAWRPPAPVAALARLGQALWPAL